jgi:hypothetical protein
VGRWGWGIRGDSGRIARDFTTDLAHVPAATITAVASRTAERA